MLLNLVFIHTPTFYVYLTGNFGNYLQQKRFRFEKFILFLRPVFNFLENQVKIICCANKMFHKLGIRSVTMDDVAKELSISKKTLYKFFKDKNDLVHKTLTQIIAQIDNKIYEITMQKINPVQKVLQIIEFMIDWQRTINPGMLNDLRKYYPEAYTYFVQHKEDFSVKTVAQNIREGIEQKYYRKNIDSEIIAHVYVNIVTGIFDRVEFPTGDTPFELVFKEVVKYHLYALCTKKGLKELEKIEWLKDED